MAFALERSALLGNSVVGLPSLPKLSTASSPSTVKIFASGAKKIKTKAPLGPSGDTSYRNGADASGSKGKGKGVYQFVNKYGANVDGYSPIFTPDEWSPNGDTYVGGTTGLAIWAVTLGGLLLAGVFLVYSTSALSQ